jgi:hypothetical protein
MCVSGYENMRVFGYVNLRVLKYISIIRYLCVYKYPRVCVNIYKYLLCFVRL